MPLDVIVAAWLALNYLLVARLAYVAARTDGSDVSRAALAGLLWPLTLLRLRRV